MLHAVAQDVRYALRMIRMNPGFSMAAIVSLALGAGANTAMFQLLDAVRLRTLPLQSPHELVEMRVGDMTHAGGAWLRESSLTNPLWERIRQDHGPLAGVFAWADEPLDVASAGDIRTIAALWVSGDFFHVLGVPPSLGRVFDADDDRRGCGLASGV